jgi:hypothetical protein
MLKSATTVVGIMLGILAISGLAVSPSEAQKIRTTIPCAAIVKDGPRCQRGKVMNCKYSAWRHASGECIRHTVCLPTGKSC